jgi:hypothetical protein
MGPEAVHSPPSSAETKNSGSVHPLPPLCLHGVVQKDSLPLAVAYGRFKLQLRCF